MPAFRKPSKVSPEAFEVGRANAEGYFAYYTGTPKLNLRKASGRTRVTRLIPARKPYPLAALLERAKESVEGRGESEARRLFSSLPRALYRKLRRRFEHR